MSAAEAWTVGRLLTWTIDYLKQHGSQSPRLDAEILLSHARGCQRIELYTAYAEEPDAETKTAFREMVRRRAEGTPVAYLVGHKEFYSASFEVAPDVLIPRPETEHLIVEALDRAKQLRESRGPEADPRLRIADVGTGSGVIAITMAKQLDDCIVTALDISPAALEIAGRNAQRHELDETQIQFIHSDLLANCKPAASFDLILSNPPYVSESEYRELDKSVRDYEPQTALVGGPQGSEIIVRLLNEARDHLVADGFLLFEFSPMLAAQLPSWMPAGWQTPTITKDFAGHARVVTLQKK